jgi:hypothetical protein
MFSMSALALLSFIIAQYLEDVLTGHRDHSVFAALFYTKKNMRILSAYGKVNQGETGIVS